VTLDIRPITLRAACAFVAEHHRHNKPVRGHKFSISCWREDELVGVINAGRPVARWFDNGRTLEVNRCATKDGRSRLDNGHVDGAASALYAAIWRAAKAMGYRRCITYTQGDEDGRSLRAAGWRRVKELDARGSPGRKAVSSCATSATPSVTAAHPEPCGR
jgi:hypothetical protein